MSFVSRSAIATGNGDFILSETIIQSPKDDEVVVKMEAAGLCHTDIDSLNWGKPIVMGHEGAGIVVEKGKKVSAVECGDHVILNWATPCSTCFQCQTGRPHLCEINSPVIAGKNGYTPGHAHIEGTTWKGKPIERSFNLGTISEYALVKSSAVVKYTSEKLSPLAASVIGCGVMTGYGSVVHTARLKTGCSAVVIGCGGVGLNVIQTCSLAGAEKVFAIDVNPSRRTLALSFGATDFIQADKDDKELIQAAREVLKLCGGRGADYAFECTAVPELASTPLRMVRNAGTAIQVSGVEQEIVFDMELFEWDKQYINPLYGGCRPQIDFPQIIGLYHSGKLKLDELITSQYSLSDLRRGLDDLMAGLNAKGVVVFD